MHIKYGVDKYPQLRFPEFSNPIQSAALSDFLVENTTRNKDLLYSKEDVLSVSDEYGVVNQIAFKGRSFAGVSVADYHIVDIGDIIYTKSPLKANPYGIIKANRDAAGIVSTLYAVYHPQNNVISEFVEYYFADDLRLNKFLKPLVNIGAKHDMKINNQFVLTGDVWFPSKAEQKKISSLFNLIQTKIKMQQSYVNSLEKYKRGVMQLLLNRKVRFKADDGSEFPEWAHLVVNDLFDLIKGTNADGKIKNVITNSAEMGLISQRDFFDKDIVVDENTYKYTVIHQGDFVYNPRKSKTAPYGPFNCYMGKQVGIVSPLYFCLRPKYPEMTPYMLYYFSSSKWYAYIYNNGAQGGARHDRVGMTNKLLLNIPVDVPCYGEQQKIAACLSAFDDVINKTKKELEAYRKLKEGLLQQMFV